MSVTVLQQSAEDRAALSGLRVDPSALADDGADYAGIAVAKPWGGEKQVYRREFSVWRLEITARAETSFHCHTEKDTMLIVSEGAVIVETFAGKRQLREGDMLIVERGVFHRCFALESAVVIEVESSSNRRDLVRLADRHGRAGRPYEFVA